MIANTVRTDATPNEEQDRMSEKRTMSPSKDQIQFARDEIRRAWSPRERDQRRQWAHDKQQQLYRMLAAHRDAVPAHIA